MRRAKVVERLVGAVDHVGPDVAGLAVGLAESAEGILAGAGGAVELVGVLAVIVAAEHAVAGGCRGMEGIGLSVEQVLHFSVRKGEGTTCPSAPLSPHWSW